MKAQPTAETFLEAFAESIAARVLERIAALMPSERPDTPKLLDRAGLAIALDVSVSSVDRLIAKGCPCIWVLDSRRFEFDSVMAWLKKTGA